MKAFLFGVGRSEVLGWDCSYALNAVGEGGLLHAGVLGSYSGAVIAGDLRWVTVLSYKTCLSKTDQLSSS